MKLHFRMNGQLAAFLCGVLFALGLGISGMSQPDKIIGFLDVTGRWDPALFWLTLAPLPHGPGRSLCFPAPPTGLRAGL